MTNPVLIPTMVPLGTYQMHMLTTELRALADAGALIHPLVEGARLRYGATEDEAQTILDRIGAAHATAA